MGDDSIEAMGRYEMKHFPNSHTVAICGAALKKGNFFPASDGVKRRRGACEKCLRRSSNRYVLSRARTVLRILIEVQKQLEQLVVEASQ
jgi:hypothetical protein